MSFDINAFDAAQVSFPTKKIQVPTLKKFFNENEEPIIEIKALTGIELALVEESSNKINMLKAALESFAKGSVKNLKDGFDELLNGETETPETYMRWITLVRLGTVPQLPEHICVKMAFACAGTLRRLAHEISIMSAMGADLGN